MEPQGPKSLEERRRSRHEGRANATYGAFLHELEANAGVDRDTAEQVVISVLSVLEQRLAQNEAKDLESELPSILRDLLASVERDPDLRPRDIDRDVFMAIVADDLGVNAAKAEQYVRAVFATLSERVSPGEIAQVINMLPGNFRELWPLGAGRT